jgi:GTP-binding protein Era
MEPTGVPNQSENLAGDHRSGFVAVVGRPNVGKSTLINRLVGQKVAIVSPRPQTTRNRLLGILTLENVQVIFLDTPGIHAPKHRLGEAMVDTAVGALADADLVLWVVDVSVEPSEEDRQVAELLAGTAAARRQIGPPLPLLLALNKVDRLGSRQQPDRMARYLALAPQADALAISAIRGDNLGRLQEIIIARLPFGPAFYPEDEFTDQQERFMTAELIREQVLRNLRDEVPHAVAVLVNEFKPRREDLTYIAATVYVERDSQKAILLGANGAMIKRIGQAARLSIEQLLGTKAYLELWVKVRPRWRKRDEELRRLGYPPPKQAKGGASHRRGSGRDPETT